MKLFQSLKTWLQKRFCEDSDSRSLGQCVADKFASVVGSWTFIIVQTCFLIGWMIVNIILALQGAWDPYPFILLNLILSFQAAFTGPVIMMSQNRQTEIDRETMIKYYELSEKIAKLLVKGDKERQKQFELLKALIEEDDA